MTILPLLLGTAQCTLSLALHLGREQRGKYIRNSGSGGGGWVCPFSYSMNFLAPVQLPLLSVDELLIMELYVFGGWTAPRSSGTASFHIVKLPASCASLWNPADSREPLLPGILGEMANNHECELNTNAKQMPLIPRWTVACQFPLLNLL